MSFLGEIRRRKVFQVAAVYAVVAWLTIQIIDVVSGPLSLPDWLATVVIILLAVGFPIAVILAWAFDLTPQGIKTASDVQQGSLPSHAGQRLSYISQGLILLAVGFLVVDQYVLEAGSGDDTSSNQRVGEPAAGNAVHSVGKPAHLLVVLPQGTHLAVDTEYPTLALSPDGSRLVFVAEESGTRRLYVRDLADEEARPIAGSEGAVGPMFSPDGSWIGFLSGDGFKRVAADGGAPMVVRAPMNSDVMRGTTWTVDDTIVMVGSADQGLSQFSIQEAIEDPDGQSTPLTSATIPSAWPDALPSGRDVLFTDYTAGRLDDAVVAVLSLDTGDMKPLVNGSTSPRYSPTGHILYARGGSLFAEPFDALVTDVTGPEFKLVDGVVTGANGAAQFAVSADGTLAYVAGTSSFSEHELVWVDRDGMSETLFDNGRRYWHPRLSPDGTLLALMSPTGPNLDVHVLNLERGNLTRWTSHYGEDFGPVWGPNGRLAFTSEIGQDFGERGPGLAWMTGPSQPPEHLLQTPGAGNLDFPTSWSPGGRWLLFSARRDRTSADIYVLDTESRQTEPFMETPFFETGARFSPADGRWVAYVSDQSGRREVYVRTFQGPGDAVQLSTNGGEEPVWSRDGGELFYREGDKLLAVALGADPTVSASPPQLLFEGRYEKTVFGGQNSNYDVSVDGRQFVMVRRKNLTTPTMIHVVLNWPEAIGSPTR